MDPVQRFPEKWRRGFDRKWRAARTSSDPEQTALALRLHGAEETAADRSGKTENQSMLPPYNGKGEVRDTRQRRSQPVPRNES